jgi:hypothetical protein
MRVIGLAVVLVLSFVRAPLDAQAQADCSDSGS